MFYFTLTSSLAVLAYLVFLLFILVMSTVAPIVQDKSLECENLLGHKSNSDSEPQHSSLTHAQDSFQCDMMRASTSRCSPIKLEDAKCFAETLGGHSTTISNLN